MFKVGDLAVFSDSGTYKNPLLKIVHIPLQKVVIVSTGINGYAEFTHLRHATPEEIAAGRRIDKPIESFDEFMDHCEKNNIVVNRDEFLKELRDFESLGDDSDLEYHVSPLCKIEVK